MLLYGHLPARVSPLLWCRCSDLTYLPVAGEKVGTGVGPLKHVARDAAAHEALRTLMRSESLCGEWNCEWQAAFWERFHRVTHPFPTRHLNYFIYVYPFDPYRSNFTVTTSVLKLFNSCPEALSDAVLLLIACICAQRTVVCIRPPLADRIFYVTPRVLIVPWPPYYTLDLWAFSFWYLITSSCSLVPFWGDTLDIYSHLVYFPRPQPAEYWYDADRCS
jgi:hypothetical protein